MNFLNKAFTRQRKTLARFLHEGLGSVAQWKDFSGTAKWKNEFAVRALLYGSRRFMDKSDAQGQWAEWDFMHIQAQKVLPEVFKDSSSEHYKKILIGHSEAESIAIIHAGKFSWKILLVSLQRHPIMIEEISWKEFRGCWIIRIVENSKIYWQKYHGEKTESMFYGWAGTWLQKRISANGTSKNIWRSQFLSCNPGTGCQYVIVCATSTTIKKKFSKNLTSVNRLRTYAGICNIKKNSCK